MGYLLRRAARRRSSHRYRQAGKVFKASSGRVLFTPQAYFNWKTFIIFNVKPFHPVRQCTRRQPTRVTSVADADDQNCICGSNYSTVRSAPSIQLSVIDSLPVHFAAICEMCDIFRLGTPPSVHVSHLIQANFASGVLPLSLMRLNALMAMA